MSSFSSPSIISVRAIAAFLFSSYCPAHAEAIFIPDEPQGIYAGAVEYEPDQDPTGVLARMLGLSKVDEEPVLTVSPDSGEYTYWYTEDAK